MGAALPPELDFHSHPEATPDRMDEAAQYLLARIRALEAGRPAFEAALDDLRAIGLQRLADSLQPVLDQSTAIRDTLLGIQSDWQESTLPETVRDDAIAAVTAAFEDYRHRYIGAYDGPPDLMPDGSDVTVGVMYFDTSLDGMQVMGLAGWKPAGAAVNTVFNTFRFDAADGQTVFALDGGYDPGYLIVAVNGTFLDTAEFTAEDGATIELAAPLVEGDELSGIAFGRVSMASVFTKEQSDARYRLVADAYSDDAIDELLAAKANLAAVYTKVQADARYLTPGGNLAGLSDPAVARANLGLGGAATKAADYYATADALAGKADDELDLAAFNADKVLAEADKHLLTFTGAAVRTLTLDASPPVGFSRVIHSVATANLAVACPGGMYLNGGAATVAGANATPGALFTVVHKGAGVWIASGSKLT
ncbi:MAG: hypothetical protein ACM3ZV_07410 [Bacillota bacterium]